MDRQSPTSPTSSTFLRGENDAELLASARRTHARAAARAVVIVD